MDGCAELMEGEVRSLGDLKIQLFGEAIPNQGIGFLFMP